MSETMSHRASNLVLFFIALLMLSMSAPANAAMRYAYIKNNLPVSIRVTLSNNGPVIGGTVAPELSVNANSSGSGNTNNTDGLAVEVYVSPYVSGPGPDWTKYYCARVSTSSFAHAQSQPCSESSKAGDRPQYALGFTTAYVVVDQAQPPNCPATTLRWGPSSFCAASVGTTNIGVSQTLSNATAGATGSAIAYCSAGTWQVQQPSCSAALAAPSAFNATQGTLAGKVQLSWNGVGGASHYEVQYRSQGSGGWTSAANASSGWALSTTSESVFEFQVRAINAAGAGPWSPIVTGFVRPQIMPVFVSQNVPTDVLAGASFLASQVWKNTGYTTWNGTSYRLLQAAGSGNFGPNGAVFTQAVAQEQSGSATLELVAPTQPGTYVLQRQFAKDGVNYGAPSAPANVKVWGAPVCSALTVSKPYLYDQAGSVSVQFSVNNQTTAQTASVWNETAGPASGKSYTPVSSAGMYKFDVPLANHGGQVGTYRVRVNVSNVVAESSCEASFELRPLATPVVILTPLIGSGATPNMFVVGQSAAQAILSASITRTENMAMTVQLLDSQSNAAASASLGAGAGSVNLGGARWTGDAWSMRPYTLRVNYADASAAAQGKGLDIPVQLILTPSGSTLTLGIAAGHPLVATSALGRSREAYDSAEQGAWASKVAVQSGADLDSLQPMDERGQRAHPLDYGPLVGKTLLATARALPPAGITLLEPLEVTASAKIPTMPVRGLSATDGTLEDIVRVTWDAPADGASGFVYDVYRGEELIQTGKSARTLDDTPPLRGQIYTYRVVAIVGVDKSVEATDPGHVPACRAARLIGASVNADMTAIDGLIERWECLTDLQGTSAYDTQEHQGLPLVGERVYRSFRVPVPAELGDGAHVLHLGLESQGVTLNAQRTYQVPFTLDRASIAVKNLSITYNGSPAVDGLEANSVGRFGVRMEGGAGIGFAEEVK